VGVDLKRAGFFYFDVFIFFPLLLTLLSLFFLTPHKKSLQQQQAATGYGRRSGQV